MHLVAFFFVLYLLALFCFVVAAFIKTPPRINLVALGLAFAFAVPVIQYFNRL